MGRPLLPGDEETRAFNRTAAIWKNVYNITLPATAVEKVHPIITELAVIEVTKEGLILKEIAVDTTVGEVIEKTGAPLTLAERHDLVFMLLLYATAARLDEILSIKAG